MRLLFPLVFAAVVWVTFSDMAKAAVPADLPETGELLYTIPNPSPTSGDLFGNGMAAIPGHLAIAARRRSVDSLDRAGAVFLFDETSGQLQHSFFNPEPTVGDEFGMSVAFVGNDLLVGAYSDDFGAPAAGSAYLFDTATGALKQTIRNPQPQAAAVFGISATAIEGGFAVGAIGVDRAIEDVGAVYLFDNDGSYRFSLENPTQRADSDFGGALASTDEWIGVAARFDREPGVQPFVRSGTVQVFSTRHGRHLRTLRSTHPVEEGNFGSSLVGYNGKFIVGAPMETVDGRADSGRVYVFDALSGELEFEIDNPTGREGEFFGWSVGIAGGNILVGAPRTFVDSRSRVGTSYLFDLETGDLITRFEYPFDRSDQFGWSVAGSPHRAFASTSSRDVVYAYSAVPEPATLLGAALGGVACLIRGSRRSCRQRARLI